MTKETSIFTTKRPVEPLRTIDDIAIMVSDGIDLNDISRILFTLIVNTEKFKLMGVTKKSIVVFALNSLRDRIPEDRKAEFEFIVSHSSDLIDGIVSIANNPAFKKIETALRRKRLGFC